VTLVTGLQIGAWEEIDAGEKAHLLAFEGFEVLTGWNAGFLRFGAALATVKPSAPWLVHTAIIGALRDLLENLTDSL
jgi:hypothetical protein